MKAKTAKIYLEKAFDNMTYQLLMTRDTEGEIKSWFDKMKAIVEKP